MDLHCSLSHSCMTTLAKQGICTAVFKYFPVLYY